MMIPMALVCLGGGAAIILAVCLILHQAAAKRQIAKECVDEDIQEKVKHAQALDSRLAREILDGADIDLVLTDFTLNRAALHALKTDKPWMWEVDPHLLKSAAAQLAVRVAAINRHARLQAIAMLLGMVLLVAAINAFLYNQLPATAPLLSPLPPSKNLLTLPAASATPAGLAPAPSPSQPTP